MTLHELKSLIQTARWFANLGCAVAEPGLIAITDMNQWQRFNAALIAAEFRLSFDTSALDEPPFAGMVWLPTSHGQRDPVHGETLATLATEQGRAAECRAARMEVFSLALESQAPVPDQPILIAGPRDHNLAARGAGRFAARMAASEVVVGQIGFWCRIIRLYHKGNWPLGLLPSGDVLVL
jgi:hypothetical protein